MSRITPFASLGPLQKSAADGKEIAKETVGATAAAPLGMVAGALATPQAVLRMPAVRKLPAFAAGKPNAFAAMLLSLVYGGAAGGGVAANAGAELAGAEKGGIGANVGGSLGGALGGVAGLQGSLGLTDAAAKVPQLKGHGGKLALLLTLLGGVGGAMGGRALGKQAAEEEAPKEEAKESPKPKEGEGDIRRQRDEKALRNRHIALALKRGGQGGLLGAILGGLKATNSDNMTWQGGATMGGVGGALVGGGIGAAEGGIKRTLGLDPILDTTLIAQRA